METECEQKCGSLIISVDGLGYVGLDFNFFFGSLGNLGEIISGILITAHKYYV